MLLSMGCFCGQLSWTSVKVTEQMQNIFELEKKNIFVQQPFKLMSMYYIHVWYKCK